MTMKEKIIKGASEMYRRQGVRSVTMDDIARELGISKRTIYEKFKDKDELLEHCIMKYKSDQLEIKQKIISESSNVLEIMYKMMYELILTFKNAHPSFFSDIKKYHSKICKELMDENRKEHIEEMSELLEKGVEDGLFRKDFSIEIASLILQVQFHAMTDEQIFPPEKYSISEIFSNIMVQFTRGIATAKGLRIIDEIVNSMTEKS